MLEDGTTVAALAVVNAVGSCVDPVTGELYAGRFGLPGEFAQLRRPDPEDVAAAAELALGYGALTVSLATTIGVVATDATLTKAQCAKVAGVGHDGMARAIRPVHTMFDGDVVFAMSTGDGSRCDAEPFLRLGMAADDAIGEAIERSVAT